MQMDTGLDTGPVLAKTLTRIDPHETGLKLTERLSLLGATLLCESLPRLASLQAEPQDDSIATYAPKLTPEVAAIDWSRQALDIHNQVRALAGRETAWTRLHHQRMELRIRVHAGVHLPGEAAAAPGQIVPHSRADLIVVQTGRGHFGISHLQIPLGKGTVQPASAARNGFPFLKSADTRFH
jgi:methionyl-tRNA formyltransferase